MSQRTERIDELLRQEMGEIIARDVADPRIGFTTITDVETTPDLRHAQVWVSVIGQPAEREAAVSALGRAMPYIRRELGSRLRLRRIPEFHVRLDDTAERGTRVLRLIQELESGGAGEGDLALGESLPTPVARMPHEGESPPEPSEPPARTRRPRRPRTGRQRR
jgi:ribosome-binding factor A